ncbi:MAG: hypothetical protein AAB425_12100, partial [Bdellovibrionota bacterium]
MSWQTFLFLAVAGAAFSYSGYRLKILIDLMRVQQGQGPKIAEIPDRLITTFVNVLGQKAVLKKRIAGIMHATIFWGFLIITIGTLEQFASTIHHDLNFQFIGEFPYEILVAVQDFFTLAVLLAVGVAVYRRYIVRPIGLGKSRDATVVLALTGSLMVSIFLMNAFHLLADEPFYQDA